MLSLCGKLSSPLHCKFFSLLCKSRSLKRRSKFSLHIANWNRHADRRKDSSRFRETVPLKIHMNAQICYCFCLRCFINGSITKELIYTFCFVINPTLLGKKNFIQLSCSPQRFWHLESLFVEKIITCNFCHYFMYLKIGIIICNCCNYHMWQF